MTKYKKLPNQTGTAYCLSVQPLISNSFDMLEKEEEERQAMSTVILD